ncbi:MAG: hypothetical protein SV760_09995, partial [Halobacteria archaeon]|nr:hypothetical protein [Halobacteria archaeon]
MDLDPVRGFERVAESTLEGTESPNYSRKSVSADELSESVEVYSEEKVAGQVSFSDEIEKTVPEDEIEVK